MTKVAFTHKDPTGRYQTQTRDGAKEVTVEGGKTFTTDDPHLIAELDACEHVERAKGSAKPSEED